MNSDDIMSDHDSPAHPSAEASAAADAKSGPAWDTKKFREEYDAFKSKLSDRSFDPADYPDPLLPRKGLKLQYTREFPEGTKERLKKLITALEAKRT